MRSFSNHVNKYPTIFEYVAKFFYKHGYLQQNINNIYVKKKKKNQKNNISILSIFFMLINKQYENTKLCATKATITEETFRTK